MRGSRNFRQGGGGVQVNLTKKALTFFFCFFLVLSLFNKSRMVNFKENYHFSRFKRGSNIFQGGSNFFQGGGGSNCLFPIESHITCDFPGGSGHPVPPLDPHLHNWNRNQIWPCCKVGQGQLEAFLRKKMYVEVTNEQSWMKGHGTYL